LSLNILLSFHFVYEFDIYFFRKILDILLCDQSGETRLEQVVQILQNVAQSVKEGTAPLSSFVITKQLSKNPDAYPDKKQLSHVMVALRLNKAGGRMWKAGDTLPYVICEVSFHFAILINSYVLPLHINIKTEIKIEI